MEYDNSIFSKFTILAYLLDSKKFNYQQFQKIFSYGVIFLLASTVFFTPYSLSPYSSQFAFALSDSENSTDTQQSSSTEENLSSSEPTPSEEIESPVDSPTSQTPDDSSVQEFGEEVEITSSDSTDTGSVEEFDEGVVVISSSTTAVPPDATESWEFEEQSSELTFEGDATINEDEGLGDGSLSLDGDLDYITTEATDSTTYISELTISAWVKPDYSNGSPEFTVLSKGSSFLLSINNLVTPQKIASFSVFDGIKWTKVETTSTIPEEWTHLSASFGEDEIRIYVNGVLESSKPLSGVHYVSVDGAVSLKSVDEITSFSDVVIGASFSPIREDKIYNMFAGLLDGVLFFDSELDSAEIASNYNQGEPTDPAWINSITLEHDQIEIDIPVTWTMNIELLEETIRGAIELPSDGEITDIKIQSGVDECVCVCVLNNFVYVCIF